MNTCNGCGLIVHEADMQQRAAVLLHRNFRCAVGIHSYEKVGHLYNNHEPPSVAIYMKCARCGKVDDSSVDMATLEYTSTRASNDPRSAIPLIGKEQ